MNPLRNSGKVILGIPAGSTSRSTASATPETADHHYVTGRAVTGAHEAIDVVEHNCGGGGLNVVFTPARELKPWRNERTVQEVNDRLLGLMIVA